MVRLGVILWKTNVFIHVEGDNMLETVLNAISFEQIKRQDLVITKVSRH
jgi:hypothetical protein